MEVTFKNAASIRRLNNGVKIPCLGFGTFKTPDKDAQAAVFNALELGYRHIDTAAVYENEVGVGKGIKQSGINRHEIFLTSKLGNEDRGYKNTKKALERSLKRLDTDYLDLYLIHWPAIAKHFGERAQEINAQTWRAMEELYHEGKIRAIGVSNFLPHHLDELMQTATIKPMVDQIEIHPGWPQTQTVAWLQQHDILVEGWGPLGGQGAHVLSNPLISQIAQHHDKTAAQITLRWELQNGILPLPKSTHPSRIKENADIFDFSLNNDEMSQISQLTNLGGACANPDDVDF